MIRFLLLLSCLSLLACSPTDSRSGSNAETVVLLHGLGRSQHAMWWLANQLEQEGFAVVRIDYSSFRETPEAMLAPVSADIARCCAHAQKVHFVGHSLGGLMIRAHLAQISQPNLGRVVTIGTPHQGTDFVDHYRERWWMHFAGASALALSTAPGSFPNSLPAPDYPMGGIAGVRSEGDSDDAIVGPHDGLVPLWSARLPGMQDFVVLNGGHAGLRYQPAVARQTVHFLRTGRFDHSATTGLEYLSQAHH